MRALVIRVIARDPPKIKVGLTREEKERIKRTFTTEEVWNVVVPGDFKGSKVEYLLYLRNERKIKKDKEAGIKHDWKHNHKACAKVVKGDHMIGAKVKKFTTDNQRIYNPYGDKNQNQALYINEHAGVNFSVNRKKPSMRQSGMNMLNINGLKKDSARTLSTIS